MPKNKQVERIAEKVEAKRRKLQLKRQRRQEKKIVSKPMLTSKKPSREELLRQKAAEIEALAEKLERDTHLKFDRKTLELLSGY
ncbi:hypothetical protein IT399_03415 [Candidatus Nomurabacteria bacterium]|nr:hypothetical protein [Candidatus Nomurabacteria bacterium]